MGNNPCCSKLKECIVINSDIDVNNNTNTSIPDNYSAALLRRIKAIIKIQRAWKQLLLKRKELSESIIKARQVISKQLNIQLSQDSKNIDIEKLGTRELSKLYTFNNIKKSNLKLLLRVSKLIGIVIIDPSDDESNKESFLESYRSKEDNQFSMNFLSQNNVNVNNVNNINNINNTEELNSDNAVILNFLNTKNAVIVENLFNQLTEKISSVVKEKDKLMGEFKINISELKTDEVLLKNGKLIFVEVKFNDNGSYFVGTIESNEFKKHGVGVYVLNEKTKYVGRFVNDMYEGKGRLFTEGDFYEGKKFIK